MKTLLKLAIPLVVVFAFITQCDSVEPKVEQTETEQIKLVSPQNSATNQSINVELEWKQIKGAKVYELMVSETENFESAVIDTLIEIDSFESGSVSFTTPSLKRETTYYWKVFPIKARHSGPWSEVWNFTTRESEAEPGAVDLLSPMDGATLESGDIKFEWEAMEGVETYIYQAAADADFTEISVDTLVTSSAISINNLEAGAEYSWRVAPESRSGPWSEIWSFNVNTDDGSEETAPKVTLVSPADYSYDVSVNAEFTWEEATGYNEYQYQLSDNNTFNTVIVDEAVNGTSFTPENLDYEKDYFWRVKVAGDHDQWSNARTFSTETEPVTTPPSSGEFVTTQNSNFMLNGETFRFAGTNAYYLPNYEKLNSGVVNRALNLFEDSGINVVRMWAFYDGFDCGYSRHNPNENVIQTSPGEYSESALRDLDNVIAKGKERGIKFILPFINYWDELGGICQYNTWAGASNPSRNMEFFLSNNQTQKWFKDYIDMLLNRVNTVTGVAYKDEPAIFAWQIIAEGRNKGADPRILRDWYQEIAQYIKSIDTNHMVTTGEEGFDNGTPSEYNSSQYNSNYVLNANEGTSYTMNIAIPEIDYGNAHWYPEDWGMGSGLNLTTMEAWVIDHKNIAASHGKPFVLGEYGHLGWGDNSVLEAYEALWNYSEEIQLDGSTLWQLVADGEKCWEFGGNICYPGGRTDEALYNSFRNHINNMNNNR